MKPSPHFPEIGKKPKDLIAKDHTFNIASYISSGADVIAAALRKHVEEEARDLSGEAFLRFMDQSNDVSENLLALRAIYALIDMPFGEGASKVSKFASFLRNVFEVKRDPEILVPASAVLGHLAKAGGAMTADEVERQIKTALGWLCGDQVEYRRFAAVLILKAFVHDTLINWRLFNFNEVPQVSNYGNAHAHTAVSSEEAAGNRELVQPQRGARERELLQAVNQLGDANEVLNERAVAVMARMSHKLTGRDFSSRSASGAGSSTQHGSDHWASGDARDAEPGLSVKVQVQKLILQATSHENLCQNYVGWCPFW